MRAALAPAVRKPLQRGQPECVYFASLRDDAISLGVVDGAPQPPYRAHPKIEPKPAPDGEDRWHRLRTQRIGVERCEAVRRSHRGGYLLERSARGRTISCGRHLVRRSAGVGQLVGQAVPRSLLPRGRRTAPRRAGRRSRRSGRAAGRAGRGRRPAATGTAWLPAAERPAVDGALHRCHANALPRLRPRALPRRPRALKLEERLVIRAYATARADLFGLLVCIAGPLTLGGCGLLRWILEFLAISWSR